MVDNKAYLISDLHFGIRNSSHEWLNNQIDYFDNFFIPYIRSEKVKNKYLLLGGDIFDNRQTLNIYIFNHVYNLFVRLSKEFKEIHIIIGNHDISNKTTNDINSLIFLKALPNVFVYENPDKKTIGSSSILFMPWLNGKEGETIQKWGEADFMIMHGDIASLRFNKYKEIAHGVSKFVLQKYKTVFSGHIHYNQERDNIIMMGSPYHLNRNDLDNEKYIYTIDLDSKVVDKHLNDYTPKFKQIDFFDLIEMTESKFNKFMENNYVYMKLQSDLSFENTVNILLSHINSKPRDIKFIYYDVQEYLDNDNINLDENENIEKNLEDFVEMIELDDKTRKKVKEVIMNYRKELNT